MYKILETDNFEPLSILFHDSGLEVKPFAKAPDGILKMWKCEDLETGQLLAAATVQQKNGYYILKHLAVLEGKRKAGLGEKLLKTAEEELRQQGAEEIWLTGKVPDFYKKYGWREVDRGNAPDISICQSCKQFCVTCFPSIMRKRFQ